MEMWIRNIPRETRLGSVCLAYSRSSQRLSIIREANESAAVRRRHSSDRKLRSLVSASKRHCTKTGFRGSRPWYCWSGHV
ncbi:hypothetical protein L1987_85528 [Smallanthus sonchifolius]|uniref:Uncharacterized protein n=1 Tax=Smallanthus sonchifolius TaxID=185202 RepID=A0ACB8XW92_9ASTR|nr:hypothetical protein L1987_85528 [Smallanthus sonchifolius]